MSAPSFNRRNAFRLAGVGATAGIVTATGAAGAAAAPSTGIVSRPPGRPRDDRTILQALAAAVHPMQNVFDPEDGDRPWFGHDSQPDLAGRTSFFFSAAFDEAHVAGRHLLGLLEARSLGITVSSDAIEKHRAALHLSLSREVPLPQNRVRQEAIPPTRFLTHNIRECLHGLLALYEHVPADAADAQARFLQVVGAVSRFWSPANGWDGEALRAAQPDIELSEWSPPLLTGAARAIGPLVRFWQLSADRGIDRPQVRQLLADLVGATLPFFPENGTRRGDIGTHTHSVTCSLSGLARYATAFGDATVLARVLAFYRLGLTTLRDEIGWSIENAGDTSDRGECNNAGDILETALLLGRAGHHECYADAAKIVRMHLLPVQLVDASFLHSPADPWDDAERDVGERITGAWGFPAPYGHRPAGWNSVSFNLDIVGGTSSSLAVAQRSLVVEEPDGITVTMLADVRTESVAVTVRRDKKSIRQTITARRPGTVRVVLPDWAEPDRVGVSGAAGTVVEGTTLELTGVRPGRPITVTIPTAPRTLHLGHQRWDLRAVAVGDRITAMDCPSGSLAAFDPMPATVPDPARGLVAQWLFDPGSATAGTVPATDGIRRHRITLHGGATVEAGPFGAGLLRLPGGPAFGTVGATSDLNFGSAGMTVAVWLRTTMTGKGRVLSRGSFGWTPGYFLSAGHGGDGHVGFGIGGGSTWGSGGSVEIATADPVLADGDWHQVAATIDSAGTARIVVDGAARNLVKTPGTDGHVFGDELRTRPSSPAVPAGQLALTIGSHLGTDEFYQGDLADLRLYGRALDPSALTALARRSS